MPMRNNKNDREDNSPDRRNKNNGYDKNNRLYRDDRRYHSDFNYNDNKYSYDGYNKRQIYDERKEKYKERYNNHNGNRIYDSKEYDPYHNEYNSKSRYYDRSNSKRRIYNDESLLNDHRKYIEEGSMEYINQHEMYQKDYYGSPEIKHNYSSSREANNKEQRRDEEKYQVFRRVEYDRDDIKNKSYESNQKVDRITGGFSKNDAYDNHKYGIKSGYPAKIHINRDYNSRRREIMDNNYAKNNNKCFDKRNICDKREYINQSDSNNTNKSVEYDIMNRDNINMDGTSDNVSSEYISQTDRNNTNKSVECDVINRDDMDKISDSISSYSSDNKNIELSYTPNEYSINNKTNNKIKLEDYIANIINDKEKNIEASEYKSNLDKYNSYISLYCNTDIKKLENNMGNETEENSYVACEKYQNMDKSENISIEKSYQDRELYVKHEKIKKKMSLKDVLNLPSIEKTCDDIIKEKYDNFMKVLNFDGTLIHDRYKVENPIYVKNNHNTYGYIYDIFPFFKAKFYFDCTKRKLVYINEHHHLFNKVNNKYNGLYWMKKGQEKRKEKIEDKKKKEMQRIEMIENEKKTKVFKEYCKIYSEEKKRFEEEFEKVEDEIKNGVGGGRIQNESAQEIPEKLKNCITKMHYEKDNAERLISSEKIAKDGRILVVDEDTRDLVIERLRKVMANEKIKEQKEKKEAEERRHEIIKIQEHNAKQEQLRETENSKKIILESSIEYKKTPGCSDTQGQKFKSFGISENLKIKNLKLSTVPSKDSFYYEKRRKCDDAQYLKNNIKEKKYKIDNKNNKKHKIILNKEKNEYEIRKKLRRSEIELKENPAHSKEIYRSLEQSSPFSEEVVGIRTMMIGTECKEKRDHIKKGLTKKELFDSQIEMNLKRSNEYLQKNPEGMLLEAKRSKIHGIGIFAKVDIPENCKIFDYVGELIGKKMSDKREEFYKKNGIHSTYLFKTKNDMIIDATLLGNLARFVNHSCVPNCASASNTNIVEIFSLREIKQGEELTFYYNFSKDDDNNERVHCNCGQNECRKFII